ncbi:MAG: hypothetical protein B6I19_05390 [Bacteroidetes bacterium 4572_114]|nr:MAG: hypothetical protein B6I19_05390 [Bacteroidetes bacterium 4572_114]
MAKRKTTLTLLLSLLILCAPGFNTFAAGQNEKYQLHFKNVVVVPDENFGEFISSFSLRLEQVFEGKAYKLIQFYEIPDNEIKAQLKANGVELLDYIPHFTYFASIGEKLDPADLSSYEIRGIIDVDVDFKLAPMLYDESYPDYAFHGAENLELMVSYYSNIDSDAAVNALTNAGYIILRRDDDGGYVHLLATTGQIRSLAALPFVVFVEPVYPTPEPENYTGRTLHRGNAIAVDFNAGRHYDGTGVSVMLQDDGMIGPHIDYEGRIGAQFLSYNYGDHGDHCAGIIMGAGNIDPKAKGNAFGATLYVYGAAPQYPGFTNIPNHYNTYDIRITSTSYSNGCNAGYTTLCRTMDQQIRNYRSLMHVFSAGNDGGSDCGYGAGPGWGNITGGHKVAKNVIAVANLNYQDELSSSSSRGPAHDGRIKPDLAAKGSSVYSTTNPNSYTYKSGTSMSCPGTSGTLAQLYQAYREITGEGPAGGLMKSLLLNTAEDLGNPGPDFKFGWGRINALRAVQVIEDNRYDSATIEQGEVIAHQFEVPENTAQMRVMVYWTDYFASVNSNWALVNNLDITVTDPASVVWEPWVLNHFPHPDSLDKDAERGADDRNNVEQVTLDYPEAGTYTLTVDGVTVPQGPQQYFIIYEYIPDGVTLTYPIGGETMAPGEDETIRWDAYGDDEPFTIEYSLDNGENWVLLSDNYNGSLRYYNWTTPTAVTGHALVRVSRGESVGQSIEPFSIIGVPENLQVDWACTGALHLSWIEVFGATSYEVFMLGEKYMEPIGTTTINSFIVENISSSGTYWFSVRAIGENDVQGQRAIAVEKTPGTSGCNEVDALMVSVPTAEWGIFQSCMDVSELSVKVKVKNYGLEPITNPDFSFQLDGGDVITESYIGVIEPDSLLFYAFAQSIDISSIGSYQLKTWIDYPPDQNPDNDMLEIPIEVIEGSSWYPGNKQTFDSWENCLSVPMCELYTCPLEGGWINLTNEVFDMSDWRVYSGSTSTGGTGPAYDHTQGTGDGHYLYIEPSVLCFYKESIVTMPCVDLTSAVSPSMSLWYHAWGSDIGRFHVDVFAGSDLISDAVEPIVGNRGNEWKYLEVDLSPYVGQVIGIRFRGITGGGQGGDFAFDDVSILDITAIDDITADEGRFSIYPNPGAGIFTITSNSIEVGGCSLKVIDMFGRVVYQQSVSPDGTGINKVIDLTAHPRGVYIVELVSEKGAFKRKLSLR